MTDIVTLDEAKLYLRVDAADEDTLIENLIAAATEAVLVTADTFDPTATEVPASLKLAVLTHVAGAYGDREDGADLPPSAGRLIRPYRTLEV